MLENVTVGTDIGLTVEAEDRDTGPAGNITFELLPSQVGHGGHFAKIKSC